MCPGGKIFASGKVTNLTAAVAECIGGPTVKLTDTYVYSPLQMIGCTDVQESTARLTGKVASNGKKIAEVGYSLSSKDFLTVIDEMVVSSFNGGYIPRWAHHKVITSKVDDESKAKEVGLKTGPLAANVPFAEVYDAAQQRKELLKLFADDAAAVDKYLPANGKQQFVATRLVTKDELYYSVQRTGSHLYETSVPVWSSIASGNWKLVSEAVRNLVPVTNTTSPVSNVDVWSGSYLTLYLPNTAGKNVYVGLPHGLKPAQFLFKYVHDPSNNQGLVFLTVNNPHLTEADKKNVICVPLPSCATKYPDFADFTKGYTYCCSLKNFKGQAEKLGLPIFKDATDLTV
ncbi:uncharacterized protein LOC103317313 [Nasonia vitripennis]|uniref:Uncharacterized protein n=1 Tax=Nasonia vitripennis TaxID=7425 RepID=A0A7M7PWD2_NASVI|nr:uncharacterized protein LOC103317313 [Nasonia vitripennis]